MKKKKWPLALLFVGAFIAIGAGVGVMMWNKAPDKVEGQKGLPVTATQLCAEFAADEAAANKKYLNQALEVTGTVSETTVNQDSNLVVILKGDDPMMDVQCTMRERKTALQAGQALTVKGFCSGSLMFSVLLTDCIIN